MISNSLQIGKLDICYRGQDLAIEYFLRKGDAKAMLYLHGLGCSKNDFLGAGNTALLKNYTLIAFDFPGCGNSTYPDGISPGMDDLVEITHLVVTGLNIGKFVIIGHSMGGLVALRYILKYPGKVKGFINVEGNLSPHDCFFSMKAATHNFQYFRDVVFEEFRRELAASDNTGFRIYAQSLEHVSRKAFYGYSRSLVEHSADADLLQHYVELGIPKLYIYGSENSGLPNIDILKNSGCKTAGIPGSNHFPFHDNPGPYYREIRNFLEKFRI